MKKSLYILVATVLFAFAANAKTVNLSDFGAVADDGMDDSAALQAAFRAVEATGGTIRADGGGKLQIEQTVRFVPSARNVNLVLEFAGGTYFEIHLANSYAIAIEAGNLNNFTIRDGVFIGRSGTALNAGYAVAVSHDQQVRIVGTQFFNFRVRHAVLHTSRANTTIESSMFDGNSAMNGGAIIYAQNWRGLTVRSTQFLDYGNFRGEYLSKSPMGVPSWIKAENALPLNAVGGRRLVIEDCSFDEGATYAVWVRDADFVSVKGTATNVNNNNGAAGFLFDNVRYALVEQSQFGYPFYDRPAIKAINGSRVKADGVAIAQAIKHAAHDATSSITAENTAMEVRRF